MSPPVDENALVLVAVMPTKRDFEIARLLGWYRIPLRMAPKIVDVDMLAFYQTGVFGEDHRWAIESVAKVRGVELSTRRELLRDEPDHPRANEEYYKISIGPLQPLDHPIPADKWKRITFFYTIGELLNQAVTINDLVVRNEERELLWKSLRERHNRADKYSQKDFSEMDLDPKLLASLFSEMSPAEDFDSFSDL